MYQHRPQNPPLSFHLFCTKYEIPPLHLPTFFAFGLHQKQPPEALILPSFLEAPTSTNAVSIKDHWNDLLFCCAEDIHSSSSNSIRRLWKRGVLLHRKNKSIYPYFSWSRESNALVDKCNSWKMSSSVLTHGSECFLEFRTGEAPFLYLGPDWIRRLAGMEGKQGRGWTIVAKRWPPWWNPVPT